MSTPTSKTIVKAILIIIAGFTLGCHTSFSAELYYPPESPPAAVTQDAIIKAKQLAESVGGKAARVASTGSMAPTITAGDIIVYKPAKVADVSVGDIVVVDQAMDDQPMYVRSLFTHRVYAKRANMGFLFTKGDHNRDVDNWTNTDANLKGVVVYIVNGTTGEVRTMGAV
jgi:signal peptidase I